MKQQFSDTNSKDIWNNHLLCAQFLRDYSGVSLLGDVQPEDITDETEKFRPFMGVEFEGDSVKRVRMHEPGEQPVYVVALLEHKSEVDFDVTLQLLKYMVGIWAQYRNEKDKERPATSAAKGFRYPLVIPIVYYEGSQPWTAAMRWSERVEFGDAFPEYIPDFTYKLVSLNEYSREEILSQEDEISLIMLFNRIQTVKDMDISQWSEEDQETARRILAGAPGKVVELLARMIYHFGHKIKASQEEITKCVRNMEDKDMGELWANMEEMDIQAERRNTAEMRQERDEAIQQRDEMKQELTETKQELTETKQELAETKQELAETKQKTGKLELEAVEAKQKIAELEQRLGDALECIAAMNDRIKES